MIVVDSSPLVAILSGEDDADRYRAAIAEARRCLIAAPNKLEVMMVAGGRFGADGIGLAQDLIDSCSIEVADWTEALSDIATQAFLRFGKGRHSAGLNFGDCMAYALAKSLDVPLFYKGNDFAKAGVRNLEAGL